MSQFAILRTSKIASAIKLRTALNHNSSPKHRDGFALPEGSVEILAGAGEGAQEGMKRWNDMIQEADLGRKIKKDTVRAIEFVVSYSPDMKGKISVDEWAKDSLKFFQKKYGEDKILQAVLHTDETTPHMHILVVPLVTKEHKTKKRTVMKTTLSAKDLTGGSKGPEKLTALQDEYHAAVAHHGLDRGIRGSKRKHVPLAQIVKEFNHAREQAEALVGPKVSLNDIPKVARKRLFGIETPDFEKAFNAIKSKYKELAKRFNEIRDDLKKEKALTKALDRNLSIAEARNNDLEKLLVDNGIDVVLEDKETAEKRVENAKVWVTHYQDKLDSLTAEMEALKHSHKADTQREIEQVRAQYQDEIERINAEREQAEQVASWWAQGYRGRDPSSMNAGIRKALEDLHERDTKRTASLDL